VGSVKVDVHKGDRQFKNLSLSDISVIKWLVLYRDKIDLYYGEKTSQFYDHAGNSKELNQELINTYAYLDDLIEKCDFKDEQQALLKLLFMGYTFKDIEETTREATSQNIKRRFNSICKAIADMNDRVWRIYIHKAYLETETKKCKKCEEDLPLTNFFFSPDKTGKDGFRNICKKCRK
jgi:hypothetical protein